MFGLIQKMDRFSNKLMTQDEKIDFIQEIVDNQMVYDMHQKYQDAAFELISDGHVGCAVLRRLDYAPANAPAVQDWEPQERDVDERPTSPFWRSICY